MSDIKDSTQDEFPTFLPMAINRKHIKLEQEQISESLPYMTKENPDASSEVPGDE